LTPGFSGGWGVALQRSGRPFSLGDFVGVVAGG
jgi:hypothetical protein